MKKIKVLQVEPSIMQYRVPIFNIIAKNVDFAVAYIDKDKSTSDCYFKKILLKTSKIGPVTYLTKDSKSILNNYDVVITSPNLRFFDSVVLGLLSTKFKTIGWNIGIRASYTLNYNTERKHSILDDIYGFLLFKFDALIFYMHKSKEFWKNKKMDKVFVAPNTTEVKKIEFIPEKKKDFLFVGTLYKDKGLDKLIYAYKEMLDTTGANNVLNIVGDGSERDAMERLSKELGISSHVVFHGSIYDESKLALLFQKSLLCISPNQAGLSVPKSMGYGVPFVCRKDAITGGEIYHITNKLNGILYSKDKELTDILIDAISSPEKYITMGREAIKYYNNNATPEIMARAALNAINYVI